VLISGTGSLAKALIAATGEGDYPAEVVAVGSDRADAAGLAAARERGVATFVVAPGDYPDRAAWNSALADAVEAHRPDWVVSAGFMRIIGTEVLARFPNRVINTHPALLPAFPGAHGVRDAIAYGARVTGASVHLVDAGVDTGPLLAQVPVEVLDGDDEGTLHERIKVVERDLLVDVMRHVASVGVRVEGRRAFIGSPEFENDQARPSEEGNRQ